MNGWCSAVGIAFALAGLSNCGNSPTEQTEEPLLAPKHIVGSYAAVRAANLPLDDGCFSIPDPARSGFLTVGVLTIDTLRNVVRRQEVHVTGEGGCARGPDTVVVDVERSYRLSGSYMLIERPVGEDATVDDTATVIGRTLVVRSGVYDFVYERVSSTDAAFYAYTTNDSAWVTGYVQVDRAQSVDWLATLVPVKGPRSQSLLILALQPPPVGTFQLKSRTDTDPWIILFRNTPLGGQYFEAVDGTLSVTESTADRVAGHFDARLRSGDTVITALGRFVAPNCSTRC